MSQRNSSEVTYKPIHLDNVCKERWEITSARSFHVQRPIDIRQFNSMCHLVNSLQSHLLLTPVSISTSFPSHAIHEFYNNLSVLSLDASSENFHKVFLRGAWYPFSLLIINQFLIRGDLEETDLIADLDQICSMLTAESILVFPQEGIPTLNLTAKYAILYKLDVHWLCSYCEERTGRALIQDR